MIVWSVICTYPAGVRNSGKDPNDCGIRFGPFLLKHAEPRCIIFQSDRHAATFRHRRERAY